MSMPVLPNVAPPLPQLALPPMPPVLLAALPTSGSTAGNNLVLLVGLGLTPATGVSFGGSAATIVSQDAFGLLTVVLAPPHAAGVVPITLTTAAGTSNVVNYTYSAATLPPTASSIEPVSGPATGGTPFTITGANLAGATVLFGALPAFSVVVAPSGTSLTGVTPPNAPGITSVTVITPAGSTTVPGGFTFV